MSGTIILGIGNRLGADDAAGTLVVDMLDRALKAPSAGRHEARTLHNAEIMTIDAGTTPESYTSVIRRHQPGLLILADAADMGLPPGSLRIIPPERIRTLSFSTHYMPLSTFISYVEGFCGKVLLVGVQPEQTEVGAPISNVVRKSARRLVKAILEGRVGEIRLLGSD
jgi:hydrogenase 3 maturation protease